MPRHLFAVLLPLALIVSQQVRAEDMTFSLVQVGDPARCGDRCPVAISAQGEITNQTPEEFAAFIAQNRRYDVRSVVFLDSPGGKVLSSMLLGRTFRRLGVAAVVARPVGGSGTQFVSGKCFSACVYALMGAQRRVVPPQSSVGIHRMFSNDYGMDPAGGTAQRRQYDNGSMREVLAQYSTTMGVSRGLIDAAEQTSSDSIRVLSTADMARWRLASAGSVLPQGSTRRGRRTH